MGVHRDVRHWIGGEWVGSSFDGKSLNPATGEVVAAFWEGGREVAESAVQAARTAFKGGTWRVDPVLRAAALSHLADAYAARIDDLIDAVCLENGKVRGEAGFECGLIPRALRFAAGLSQQHYGRVADPVPGQQAMSIRQPVGVAGIIVPWNSAAYLMIRSLGPALAAGCTAVVKMPAQGARMAALHSEIIGSVAEIPKGVVNIFTEAGSDGARWLVDSPHVPVISFTGSSQTGRDIARAAAANLKRVGLELGGKTPHLVFDDADLNAVLPVLEKSSTVFAGQFCMTGSRILVQRGIAERLKAGLKDRFERVRLGPASDPNSDMGPMIDKGAVARVDAAVEEALRSGATAIVRGGPSKDAALADGAFHHPTLLEVTDGKLPIVQKETFGPVQTLQVFDTEEEAVELANDSEYGLHACVWSRDVDRPIRVARQLEVGFVAINGWASIAIEFEEGGYKASGVGRLCGVASLDDFLEYKQITQNYGSGGH